ncbi:WXG100 family type VII secretion target [Cryptosporangium minutisporangium]|uniref:Excreted virulence factor EspC (Type VII ESX diderm) n=1 Tax=Cryptosporangium minutisporangium TaxID=113569 RepID=A0ABP6SU48_9ACTN
MGTRVNPVALLTAAGVAGRFADVVRQEATSLETDTDAAVRALPGFRTREVLDRLQFGWVDALGRHRDYLDRLGDALSGAAQGYLQSDAETAASFTALDRF